MPPKRSITLTQAELRLMKVLWDHGESTVANMVSVVSDEAPLAYTSVLTAFVYAPCVAETEASRSEVRHVLQRFFGNSRERLLLSLLGDDQITPSELKRLKEAIALAPDDAQEER